MRKVGDFLAFQVVWFACVLGAGKGYGWIGPASLTCWLLVYSLLSKRRLEELLLAAACGFIGVVVDTLHIKMGTFSAARFYLPAPFCPLWLFALWINMGPLINSSLGWLKGRYFLAMLFGALGGPIAYWGGMRLGAISFSEKMVVGLFILACTWAVIFPILIWVSNRFKELLYYERT